MPRKERVHFDKKSKAAKIVNNDADEDETDLEQELYENKLDEIIDGLVQKSSNGRINCSNQLEKCFTTQYIPELLEERKITIVDYIEKGLKKGGDKERSLAARLGTLICVQLETYESAETICNDLKSTLMVIAKDTSAPINARLECCWALGFNQFVSGNNPKDAIEIKQILCSVFEGSYPKENSAVAVVSAEMAALHSAAISSWTLLLTIMSPVDVYNSLSSRRSNNYLPSLTQLTGLLQSSHVDIRIAAGEALAVIFELGRDHAEDYEKEWESDLIEILQELATDSNKCRSNKDRKQQRAIFRDILCYIEEGIIPEISMILENEKHYLEGWCAYVQYNAFCRILGPGINVHLLENELLRDIFNLGDRITKPDKESQKAMKLVKAAEYAAAFKARTIERRRARDKRSNFIE